MKSKVYKRSQIFPQFYCRGCGKVVSPEQNIAIDVKTILKYRKKILKHGKILLTTTLTS